MKSVEGGGVYPKEERETEKCGTGEHGDTDGEHCTDFLCEWAVCSYHTFNCLCCRYPPVKQCFEIVQSCPHFLEPSGTRTREPNGTRDTSMPPRRFSKKQRYDCRQLHYVGVTVHRLLCMLRPYSCSRPFLSSCRQPLHMEPPWQWAQHRRWRAPLVLRLLWKQLQWRLRRW